MAKRQVIQIPGMEVHGANPIPLAVKVGNMVFTGSIPGRDPATNTIPDDADRQIVLAFENMRRIMELAGGSTDDIAKVVVNLKDLALREIVNREWVKMFPDPESRPARHAVRADIPGNMVIQMEMTAVI
jgi:2-iminobutanoate/2-iminopropanoate deaminase